MRAEYLALKKRAATQGPSRGDYERLDTKTSLLMGVGSLIAPLVLPRLLKPCTPGKGKFGKALVGAAVGATAVTTIADAVARRAERQQERERARTARKVAEVSGVAAVVTGGLAVTTWWASVTSPGRLWEKGQKRDKGTGPFAVLAAIIGWDFIYYWSHRMQHESRYMWAIHVVHHSSERYNLSTALRQPVADAFGTFIPYSSLCLLGFRPEVVETARGVNLLYQYWIHTETIRALPPKAEQVLNTPSHHRVHHGSNQQYLDRNHGSILIIWDRLFGTFEPEDEEVVYGLTKNIDTYAPLRVATHEYRDILRDVARSTTWRERLSYVVHGPGWAYDRHRELESAGQPTP
ncbi:MAG: sterol desaturase family protein [Actinobacteria bacterium]|nr:sterol desaturase family protein [Actinomycetota bacterium]